MSLGFYSGVNTFYCAFRAQPPYFERIHQLDMFLELKPLEASQIGFVLLVRDFTLMGMRCLIVLWSGLGIPSSGPVTIN